MIRTPNRAMQVADYKTGTPNYLDLTGGAVSGMRTVATVASSDSWSDGDTNPYLDWVAPINAVIPVG